MTDLSSREGILAEACRIAAAEPGGTLATLHAEDGTPYVTYVLFHLRADGLLLFGSLTTAQHAKNLAATPETSFLIDNREAVRSDWTAFDRVVIEGRAELIAKGDARYDGFIAEVRGKNERAAMFTDRGLLYCIHPRRMLLTKGLTPGRHIVEFRDPA
jgi:pyridoxine/pyridoxamine 5'-phosphate oxidase